MRMTFQILWIVLVLGVLVCVAAVEWFAGQYVWVDYAALIPQWLFMFPLLLLVATLWGVFHAWWSRVGALVVLIVIVAVWVTSVDVVWRQRLVTGRNVFTVMSWNTASWDSGRRDDFIALLKAHPSDVYLLQEVQFKRNPDLHGYMLENFPEYQAGHYGEFFTLSKFPLNCNISEPTGVLLGCVAQTPEGSMTLVNVHLKRPFHVTNFRTFEDFEIRKEQYAALRGYLNRITGPVLIAGDFNTTANYPFIEELTQKYQRNDPLQLFAWPHTFPANAPYMRIDYQFVSAPYSFCDYEAVKEPLLSDHVGIVGTVCF